MKKWIQTMALALTLTLAIPFIAPAAEIPEETSALETETEESPETETEEITETEDAEISEIESEDPAETEEIITPLETEEITEPEETELPEEPALAEETEESVKPEETETEEIQTEEITETEETEEGILDDRGYAGMGYASWLADRAKMRSGGINGSGSATLRNPKYQRVQGIDISEMNTITDWAKVKASGVEVVIIRVGGRGYTEGKIYDDDMFVTNVKAAYKAGMKIGVYFFSQAINTKEAIAEADYCAEKMAPYKKYITLPVYMDYEWSSGWGYRLEEKGGSVTKRTETIKAFCTEIKNKGYKAGFYSFDSLMANYVNCAALADVCSIWIAHWGVSSPGYEYTGVYDSWQYTSDGSVPGITGRVDMDWWYLSEKELEPAIPGTGENIEGKEGVFTLTSVAYSGYSITVGTDGNLTLKKSTGKNNQRFILTEDTMGRYRITSFLTGNRFDCEGGGKKTGTNVQTLARNNKVQQTWLLQKAANGAYYIVAYNSGYKIAIDSSTKNIQLGTRDKTSAQAFRLTRVSSDTVSEGWYTVKCASSTGYVLDVANGSYENGANVQIYSDNGTPAQKLYIQKLSDGYYRMMSAKSGKMIDVKGEGKGDDINIHQYEANGYDTQKWIILKNNDGTYSFFSKSGKRALTVRASKFAKNTNVYQTTYIGTEGQKFKLAKRKISSAAPVPEGRYYILSKGNTGFMVSVAGSSYENEANIRLATRTRTTAQQFILFYQGSRCYWIYNNHSGKLIEVKNGSLANKANVRQYEADGTPTQTWKIRKNKDGSFTLINNNSKKAMEIAAARFANKTNIRQYTDNGSKEQKFILKKP